MKKILALVILLGMSSCQETVSTIDSTPKEELQNNEGVKQVNSLGQFPYNKQIDQMVVVEVDGCQYIVLNSFSLKEPVMTHKGNCKFCIERQELLIQKYTGKFVKDTLQ